MGGVIVFNEGSMLKHGVGSRIYVYRSLTAPK